MRNYSQEEIDALIRCPKRITRVPKKQETVLSGSERNEAELTSTDGHHKFHMFMRVNTKFPENFSIGMDYLPTDDERFCLLRCNGPHGAHRKHVNPDTGEQIENTYHIHRTTDEAIAHGDKPESHAEITAAYASFHDALSYFVKEVNVEDASSAFPNIQNHEFNLQEAGTLKWTI